MLNLDESLDTFSMVLEIFDESESLTLRNKKMAEPK